MELKLTPRLHQIGACVPAGARLADIGTDHGYLPVRLVLDGRLSSAIAADLRAGPLARARETARRFGVEERISFRLCDGLLGISADETDTVVIAGMGGETIAAILAAAPWTREGTRLLLQPMTMSAKLRGWLCENGYRIEEEHIVQEDKRFYTVMEVTGGWMAPLTLPELWAGKQSDDPLRAAWLDHISAKVSRALSGQMASRQPDEAEIARLTQVLDALKKMREEL